MHLGAYPYCKAVKKRKERNSAPSHDPSIQGRTKRKERRESRKREERKRVKTDMRARPRSRDLELKLLSAMDTYWHRSLLRSIPLTSGVRTAVPSLPWQLWPALPRPWCKRHPSSAGPRRALLRAHSALSKVETHTREKVRTVRKPLAPTPG